MAYDNDYTTYVDCDTYNEQRNKILVDSECWGKYVTIYNYNPKGTGYGDIMFYSSTNIADIFQQGYIQGLSGGNMATKTAKSIKIPENTKMIAIADGTDAKVPVYVYEIKCTDENLTNQEF